MVEESLVKKIVALWNSQSERAKSVNPKRDPGTLQGVYEVAVDVMNEATTKLFRINRSRIGSWVKGEDLPLQLFSTRVLTVDLTIDELRKAKPFEIPLESLIKMEKQGLLYLNIRDYDSEKKLGFSSLCSGVAAENLERLLAACSNIYIGSALREPIFDKCLSWEGLGDLRISKIQEDCYRDLIDASRAFDEEFQSGNLANEKTIFRGEKFNMVAISWNFAFLRSVRSKLDDYIFSDSRSDGRTGLESQYGMAAHYGSLWRKTKGNEDRARAARAFLEFAGEVKTYHQLYTANITASWGTCYNLTGAEFNQIQSRAIGIQTKIDVQSENVLQRFVAGLYSDRIGIGAKHFSAEKQVIYDEGKIDAILQLLVEKDGEMKAIYSELADYSEKYLRGQTYTRNDLSRLRKGFDEMDNKYYKSLKKVFSSGVTLSLLNLVRGAEMGVSDLFKADIKINLPDVAKKILIPSPERRMLFNVYMQKK